MGKFLFKYRSFFPIPYFLFLLIVFEFRPLSFFLGCGIVFFGLTLRFFSQGFAGDWTRGNKIQAEYLFEQGAYSIMRHPLYTGNFFIGLGFTIASNFYLIFLLPSYSLMFFVYYYFIVKEEENFLVRKFGEGYIKYRRKTPAVFPNFGKWKNGKFLGKSALRMEKSTYITVIFIFVLFLIKVFLISH